MKKILLIIISFLLFTLSAQSQYWQRILSIPAPYHNNYWLDVYFFPGNANFGWICGFNGMVIRTTDGGASWAGDTVPGAYHLESIHFPNTSVGYTSGVDGIWKSTNGGASWFSVKPSQAGDSIHFWGCYFYDSNNGVVVGEGCAGSQQYFWRTANGGTTWTFSTGNEFDSGLTDAILLATGQGLAVSSGRLWQSGDGGYTWSVFANSGTNLWQEEITYFNSSLLVPYAGSNCQGGGTNGGMRFSADGGSSWTDVNVATPMFGAFLLNDNEGWACGYNRAIYYTSNAGVSWSNKNCGIEPGNLDDIWFSSNNVGWVVGQGVYKYSPATHGISKTMIDFIDGCISSPRFDTLYVRNVNFNSATANWQLTGADASDFSIITPSQNFNMPPCDSVRFVIRFNPVTPGSKTANLRIDIPGFTVLLCGLRGSAQRATARLSDTLIVVDSAECGKTIIKTVTWSSGTSNEYVSSYSRTGSPDVTLNTSVPFMLSISGIDTRFVINPTDTGWQTARFKFRMQPCNTDTFITVKFYGYSPIINSIRSADAQGECVQYKDIEIPVSNTGNNPLIISSAQIINPANGFNITGWKTGFSTPRVLNPLEADTMIVRFNPSPPGTFSAKLRLMNNDMTKTRGTVNPYDIDLNGTILFADVETSDTLIDLGDVCVGDSSSVLIKLYNSGNMEATLTNIKNTLSVFRLIPINVVYPVQIRRFDSVSANIFFIPSSRGNFTDTFLISTFPCDKIIRVIVKGRAVITNVTLNPSILTGTVYNYSSTQATCRLTNLSSDDIIVNGYNFTPALNLWNASISPALPVTISPGNYTDFIFTFSTQQDSSLTTKVCFEIDSKCPVNTCADVRFNSINDPISIMPDPLDFGDEKCLPFLQTKQVQIYNLSSATARLDSLYITPQGSGFSIQNLPALPYQIAALDSLTLNIDFLPITEGSYNADIVAVCSLSTVKAKLTGLFRKSILSPSPQSHSFSNLESCQSPVTKPFRFFNNGLLDDTLEISFSFNSAGFSVDKTIVPIKSNDSTEIVLSFNPGAALFGNNSCSINIIGKVCGQTLTLTADASIVKPVVAFEPVVLNFDNVWINDTLRLNAAVTNKNNIPVIVTVVNLSTNTDRLETDLTVPFRLAGFETKPFSVSLIANKSGRFTDTLVATYQSVCTYDTALILISYIPDEIYKVRFEVPDYKSEPSEEIYIEIILTDSVYKFRPDSMTFGFNYDPWLFRPDGAYYNSNAGLIGLAAEFNPGNINISVPTIFADTLFLTRGTKFRIHGWTYSSSPNISKLDIDEINLYTSQKIDLLSDDGLLEISPVCIPIAGQHFIFSDIVSSELKSDIVSDGEITLLLNAARSGSATLTLFSIEGAMAGNQKLRYIQGRNELILSIDYLANGSYYFILDAASGQKFIKRFIVVR